MALINGKPLPQGVTMNDWMRLHYSPGFYDWINAVRGCGKPPSPWRIGLANRQRLGWCGI